jgi:Tfp pilus assembly protein PilN
MAFTPRFFSEKLKIPVEYLTPFQGVSLAPHIDKEKLAEVAHMFSEVIGLGLRHVTECPIEISLVPPSVRKQHELRRKTPYFLASAASLIVCLSIFLGAVERNRKRSENMVTTATKMLNITKSKLANIQDERAQLQDEKAGYETAAKMLADREDWFNVLDELQRILPDNMWFVRIAPSSAPKAEDEQNTSQRPASNGRSGAFMLGGVIGERRPTEQNTVSANMEWIELKGFSLSLNPDVLMIQKLKDRLLASPVFTNNDKEIVPKMRQGEGINDNLFKFTMTVKLAKPIKR